MAGSISMNDELKRTLLTRKFSSIEYMEEFRAYLSKAIAGFKESLQWFNDHPPKDVDWQSWHISDKAEEWERRALPNFERMLDSADEGIKETKKGNISVIRSLTGSMQGLSKDMDVLGEKWWDYVDLEVARKYGLNMNEAEQRASNIWRTVGEYWKTPESILKETITGPIDEEDLLHYLQPGESAD